MAKKEKAQIADVEIVELEVKATPEAIAKLERWIELAGASGVISVTVDDLQKIASELK